MSNETSIAPLRERPAWAQLTTHHEEIERTHLRELFDADPERGQTLTAEGVGLFFSTTPRTASPPRRSTC